MSRYAVTVGYRREAMKKQIGWHGRCTVYVEAKNKRAAMDKAKSDARSLHRDVYDTCAFDATLQPVYGAYR